MPCPKGPLPRVAPYLGCNSFTIRAFSHDNGIPVNQYIGPDQYYEGIGENSRLGPHWYIQGWTAMPTQAPWMRFNMDNNPWQG